MKLPHSSSPHFPSSERGASLVDYSLLVVFIALIAWAAIAAVGQDTSETFEVAAASISGEYGDGVAAGGPFNGGSETGDPSDPGDSDQTGPSGSTGGGPTGGGPGAGGNGGPGSGDGQDTGSGGPASSDDDSSGTVGDGSTDGGNSPADGSSGDADLADNGDPVTGPADSEDEQESDGSAAGEGQEDEADGSGPGGDDASAGGSGGTANGTEDDDEEKGFPGLNPSKTAGDFYWWDQHNDRGQWTADFTYSNATDRHQYLEILVTRTFADGSTQSQVVHSHYVPAKGSSTMTIWSNDFQESKPGQFPASNVVKVEATVFKVSTSDQKWNPYSTPTNGPTMVVDVPPRP